MKKRRELYRELITTHSSNKSPYEIPKKKDRNPRNFTDLPVKEPMRKRGNTWPRQRNFNYARLKSIIEHFFYKEYDELYKYLRNNIPDFLFEKEVRRVFRYLCSEDGFSPIAVVKDGILVPYEHGSKKKQEYYNRTVYLQSLDRRVPKRTLEVNGKEIVYLDGIYYWPVYTSRKFYGLYSYVKDLEQQSVVYPTEKLISCPTRKYTEETTLYITKLKHLTKKELKELNLKNNI